MDRRTRPWIGLALIVMAGFMVWLFVQMTRTPQSSRLAWTLAACAAGLTLLLLLMTAVDRLGRRRRRRAPRP